MHPSKSAKPGATDEGGSGAPEKAKTPKTSSTRTDSLPDTPVKKAAPATE